MDFKALILAKEQELHSINEFRISSLESMCQAKDAELVELRARLEKIREDYAYNLSLFESRDSELGRLEGSVGELSASLSAAQTEAGRWRGEAEAARARATELESFHEAQLGELREGIASARVAREEEMVRWRAQAEALRASCDTAVREAGERAENAVREATEAGEAAAAAARRSARRASEEAASAVAASEERCAAAVAAAAAAAGAEASLKEQLAAARAASQSAERETQRARGELERVTAHWESRLAAAGAEREAAAASHGSALAGYEARMSELLESLRMVERAFGEYKAEGESREREGRREREREVRESELRESALSRELERERGMVQRLKGSVAAAEAGREEAVAGREAERLGRAESERAGEVERVRAAGALAGAIKRAEAGEREAECARMAAAAVRAEMEGLRAVVGAMEAERVSRGGADLRWGAEVERLVGERELARGEALKEREGKEAAIRERDAAKAALAAFSTAAAATAAATPSLPSTVSGAGTGSGGGAIQLRSSAQLFPAPSSLDSTSTGLPTPIARRSETASAAVAAAEEALAGLDTLGGLEVEVLRARERVGVLEHAAEKWERECERVTRERDVLASEVENLRVQLEATIAQPRWSEEQQQQQQQPVTGESGVATATSFLLETRCRELESAAERYKGVIGEMREHIEGLEAAAAAAAAASKPSFGGSDDAPPSSTANAIAAAESAAYKASAEVMLASLLSEREALSAELSRAQEYVQLLQTSSSPLPSTPLTEAPSSSSSSSVVEECSLLRRHVRAANDAAASARLALRAVQAQLATLKGEVLMPNCAGVGSSGEGKTQQQQQQHGKGQRWVDSGDTAGGDEEEGEEEGVVDITMRGEKKRRKSPRVHTLPVDLSSELLQLREECVGLRRERDGLLELSNSLRAQENNYTNTNTSSSHSSHYLIRMGQLEAALHTVTLQNAALHSDLERLLKLTSATAGHYNHHHSSTTPHLPLLYDHHHSNNNNKGGNTGRGGSSNNTSSGSASSTAFPPAVWLPVSGDAQQGSIRGGGPTDDVTLQGGRTAATPPTPAASSGGIGGSKTTSHHPEGAGGKSLPAGRAAGSSAPSSSTSTANPSGRKNGDNPSGSTGVALPTPSVLPMRTSSSAANVKSGSPTTAVSGSGNGGGKASVSNTAAAAALVRAQKVPNYAKMKSVL